MIYTTDKYTINIDVSHVCENNDTVLEIPREPDVRTFIIITLLYGVDTYICCKNINEITGFNVIARSVDNFINYFNKIISTNQLVVTFNETNKVFTLSFDISNGIVCDTYSFDCVYGTAINDNNSKLSLLKTINSLSNISNLSSNKLDLNIKLIAFLLKHNKFNIDNFDIDNIMCSLCNNITLISSFENNILLTLSSTIGSTLLMFAAQQGNIEVVTYLVKCGADINVKNNYCLTALHYAVEKSNIDVVTFLVDCGANINLKTDNGYTALIFAAQHSNIDVVTFLVDRGADINIKNNNGYTALMYAVEKSNIEIVSVLVDCGADINIQNYRGKTAFTLATEKNNIEIIKILVNKM